MKFDDTVVRVEYSKETKKKFRVLIRNDDGSVALDVGFFETPGLATKAAVEAVKDGLGKRVWQSDEVKSHIPQETN